MWDKRFGASTGAAHFNFAPLGHSHFAAMQLQNALTDARFPATVCEMLKAVARVPRLRCRAMLLALYCGCTVNAQTIQPTANPLVASYSASCAPGNAMAVLFQRAGDTHYQTTSSQTCTGSPLTFLIAGMRIDSQYTARHRITPVSGSPRSAVNVPNWNPC